MTRWGLFGAAVMVAMAGVANAQTTPPPATAGADVPVQNGRGGRGQRAALAAGVNPTVAMSTVQNMLDGYVLKQAQNALQLSDSQWLVFLPKMDALQKLRRQHLRAHTQLINQLNQAAPPPRAGTQSSADEATLAARVKAVDDLEAQMVTNERAAVAAVDSVLTVYQRARFRVFEENMEREKLRLLAKVMADPANGGPSPATVPPKHGGR